MNRLVTLAQGALAATGGALTGVVIALATSTRMANLFGSAGNRGGLELLLAAITIPSFFIVGAIAGVLVWRSVGGWTVAAIAGASPFVAIVLIEAAEYRASDPPPLSASGCTVFPHLVESGASGTVTIDDWYCPTPPRKQLHVSVFPTGAPMRNTSPGNLLVLDASGAFPGQQSLVFVTSDSIGYQVAYDHRARVLRQASHVGVKPVRYLDLDARGIPRRDDTAASAPAAPPAPSETASPTCRNDVREWGVVQRWSVTIFRRSCAGQPATIDVSVIPSRATFDQEAPGNVLSFDASAETPADTIRVRVASFDGRALMIGHDRRTFARRFSSSMEKLRIGTVVETDSALRRGSFDRQPSTPAAR